MNLREVFARDEIKKRVQDLGREISIFYGREKVLGVCVLKGAFVFFADLVRSLEIDMEIDFVRLSSYGDDTVTSGEVTVKNDLETDVWEKNVLVVEDIVDTGVSLYYFRQMLLSRGASSVRICALIDKHERRQLPVSVDFCGFRVQKGFLVGYGLDMAQKYRNLPGIYAIDPSQE
ncbi:hypoxanthine phosphoribosyltransferase [Desulfonatronospira thiodismutans ASO3-1]|uniref:Hypoxanthine phosphoribosyltransferase n=1 Tax=Desulfonatronospira thiodismutans ASO3-1 TaxID=555779 RepID=D6SQV4_9BACT|nr:MULTISPECIES: hypoxanthine phosphoribosyltransferase [Desulfonatronospira]EFI35130.1 hypoxanthine phosphoribosyltransferase [Desulfonatronospira thiodismutans ASO3-1]RQD75618.1 MAG: hypoxanthine phosphoribosyltransferase [Desulfonatronospira sp. MSAO_Bac3]